MDVWTKTFFFGRFDDEVVGTPFPLPPLHAGPINYNFLGLFTASKPQALIIYSTHNIIIVYTRTC